MERCSSQAPNGMTDWDMRFLNSSTPSTPLVARGLIIPKSTFLPNLRLARCQGYTTTPSATPLLAEPLFVLLRIGIQDRSSRRYGWVAVLTCRCAYLQEGVRPSAYLRTSCSLDPSGRVSSDLESVKQRRKVNTARQSLNSSHQNRKH